MRNEKNVKNKGGKYFKWLHLDTQTNDIKKLFNIIARTVLKISLPNTEYLYKLEWNIR